MWYFERGIQSRPKISQTFLKQKEQKAHKSKNPRAKPKAGGLDYVIKYRSGKSAVCVHSNGNAYAKWPSGNVALTVDRESYGHRLYAYYSDGSVAALCDPNGTVSVNFPNGLTCISYNAGGDSEGRKGKGFMLDQKGNILISWGTDGKILRTSSLYGSATEEFGCRMERDYGFSYNLKEKLFRVYFSSEDVRFVFKSGHNDQSPPDATDLSSEWFQPHNETDKRSPNSAKRSGSFTPLRSRTRASGSANGALACRDLISEIRSATENIIDFEELVAILPSSAK
eukprot:14834_1